MGALRPDQAIMIDADGAAKMVSMETSLDVKVKVLPSHHYDIITGSKKASIILSDLRNANTQSCNSQCTLKIYKDKPTKVYTKNLTTNKTTISTINSKDVSLLIAKDPTIVIRPDDRAVLQSMESANYDEERFAFHNLVLSSQETK